MNGAIITLLSNEYFVWCAMAVIIFLLTQVLKLPYKACTKHIKNERTRKIVNAFILLIPFGLGLLAEFLYGSLLLPAIGMASVPFYGITGLSYGAGGVSIYGLVERFFKVKISNPYTDTEEGKAVKEFVDKVVSDGKVDDNDIDAVKEFWDKINK